MRFVFRLALVGVVSGYVLVNGLGCASDEKMGGQAGQAALDLSDVIYEGEVTDEALESMLGGTLSTDDTKAAIVSAPASGDVLPAASPATFTWSASTASLGPSLRFAPVRSPLRGPRLPAWLGAERSAHAHGTPFTGVAYFVDFSTAKSAHLLRVATDQTSYTPGDAAWAKLKAAGTEITITITSARLEKNLLVDAGGPYASADGVSFTIN